MISSGPPDRCYLVEWYQPDLRAQPLDDAVAHLDRTAAAASAEGSLVQLLMTMVAPSDEVLYSIFTADSADEVSRVCRLAGWPADRITVQIEARINGQPC